MGSASSRFGCLPVWDAIELGRAVLTRTPAAVRVRETPVHADLRAELAQKQRALAMAEQAHAAFIRENRPRIAELKTRMRNLHAQVKKAEDTGVRVRLLQAYRTASDVHGDLERRFTALCRTKDDAAAAVSRTEGKLMAATSAVIYDTLDRAETASGLTEEDTLRAQVVEARVRESNAVAMSASSSAAEMAAEDTALLAKLMGEEVEEEEEEEEEEHEQDVVSAGRKKERRVAIAEDGGGGGGARTRFSPPPSMISPPPPGTYRPFSGTMRRE